MDSNDCCMSVVAVVMMESVGMNDADLISPCSNDHDSSRYADGVVCNINKSLTTYRCPSVVRLVAARSNSI
jgi:hypothetical protein